MFSFNPAFKFLLAIQRLSQKLSVDEKSYLTKIQEDKNAIYFHGALELLSMEGNYRDGDLKRLWDNQAHAKLISCFCEYSQAKQITADNPFSFLYIDLILGREVDYAKLNENEPKMPYLREFRDFIEIFIVTHTWQERRSSFSLRDIYYFSKAMKGLYDHLYPETHRTPVLKQVQLQDKTSKYPSVDMPDKEKVLDILLLQLAEIFKEPAAACFYLRNLEEKLQSLSKNMDMLEVAQDHYEWRKHMSIYYPVPTKNFRPVKQHHLLSRALIELLQGFGLANMQLKLLGITGADTMEQVISKGHYFSETALNHSLLLHGKTPHMIQILLICELMKAGKLSVQYDGDQHLTIHDVLERLLQPFSSTEGDKLAWNRLMDYADFSYASGFQNPYGLQSYLMMHGDFHELPRLSSSMKMSFLKNYQKCTAFYSVLYRDERFSTDDLWKIICLTHSGNVLPFDRKQALALEVKGKAPETPLYEGYISTDAKNPVNDPYFIMVKKIYGRPEKLTVTGTLQKEYTASEVKMNRTK